MRKALRRDLGLKYRRLKPHQSYVDYLDNIESRRVFAEQAIDIFNQQKILVNIDE